MEQYVCALQATVAAEILCLGWREESRAAASAAPPVVGDGLFWKFHLLGRL